MPRNNAHYCFFLPAKNGETHNPFIDSLYLFASVKTGSEYPIPLFQRFQWYPSGGNCRISEPSTVPWISIVKIPRMLNQSKTIFSPKMILKSIHYIWKKVQVKKLGVIFANFGAQRAAKNVSCASKTQVKQLSITKFQNQQQINLQQYEKKTSHFFLDNAAQSGQVQIHRRDQLTHIRHVARKFGSHMPHPGRIRGTHQPCGTHHRQTLVKMPTRIFDWQ